MKKHLLLLASLMLMLLVMTACGKGAVTPSTATLPSSSEVTGDTFIVATESETERETETQEPTENNRVTIRENTTVERNEETSTGSSVTPTPTTKPAQATQSNKTWHNAVYQIVEHPSETEEVWIVDKEAYTTEMPVYGDKEVIVCDVCLNDITLSIEEHYHENGYTYHTETQTYITGTELITVPEEGHYETVVIKEAWTERILVKEAGYY